MKNELKPVLHVLVSSIGAIEAGVPVNICSIANVIKAALVAVQTEFCPIPPEPPEFEIEHDEEFLSNLHHYLYGSVRNEGVSNEEVCKVVATAISAITAFEASPICTLSPTPPTPPEV